MLPNKVLGLLAPRCPSCMVTTITFPWSSKLLPSALLGFGTIVPWPVQALNVKFFCRKSEMCPSERVRV